MAIFDTPDQVGLKNGMAGTVRIRRGSTVGCRTTICKRQLPPSPPLFPLLTEGCPADFASNDVLTVATSIIPSGSDTTSATLYGRTWTLGNVQPGPGGQVWQQSVAVAAPFLVATLILRYCCPGRSWMGLFQTQAIGAAWLGDIAGSRLCGAGLTDEYPTSASTMDLLIGAFWGGTLQITGSAAAGFGTGTIGTIANMTIVQV